MYNSRGGDSGAEAPASLTLSENQIFFLSIHKPIIANFAEEIYCILHQTFRNLSFIGFVCVVLSEISFQIGCNLIHKYSANRI